MVWSNTECANTFMCRFIYCRFKWFGNTHALNVTCLNDFYGQGESILRKCDKPKSTFEDFSSVDWHNTFCMRVCHFMINSTLKSQRIRDLGVNVSSVPFSGLTVWRVYRQYTIRRPASDRILSASAVAILNISLFTGLVIALEHTHQHLDYPQSFQSIFIQRRTLVHQAYRFHLVGVYYSLMRMIVWRCFRAAVES